MPAEPFIIPTIGTSGFFQLREPFATLIDGTVRYTCQAIRRVSEYVANNEQVKEDVYDKYQLGDDVWLEDMNSDAMILSLQSETGHWLYVPVRYNISYPNTNGIPYRSIAIGINLPALPANRDFSDVITALQNVIRDTLGVDSKVKIIETSKVSLIDSDIHAQKNAERELVRSTTATDRSNYMSTLQQLTRAIDKIAELENHILQNP
jgi:uncharacterized protein YqgV (UPF0045/DUF77 family)